MMKGLVIYLSAIIMVSGCTSTKKEADNSLTLEAIPLSYATGFTIDKTRDYYLVKVLKPYKGATKPLVYVFYNREQTRPDINADVFVQTPVQSIVCTSTTHIPLLEYLDETESLKGFPTLDYISSHKVRERINKGEIEELGIDEALNLEKIIDLQPDLLMGYSMTADFGQFSQISEAGIPVILNAEYLEKHPLGRAEWIKLAGIIFNKQEKADSVFSFIENEYLSTLELVKGVEEKPTVLSGIVYGDSWFVPGGKNYAAKMLRDAGFTYFWEQDTSSAFLPLSFETVFNQAHNAEVWIGVGSFRTLVELAAADSRYETFQPFKKHRIYSYNKRLGAKGGSEFLELGYLRPDLILKDLVKISHPNLLPEHELFFYFQLP